MKGAVNGLSDSANWMDAYPFELADNNLMINFTRQQWPVHYYQKEFINERIRAELTSSV
jgi:hypothetical protein